MFPSGRSWNGVPEDSCGEFLGQPVLWVYRRDKSESLCAGRRVSWSARHLRISAESYAPLRQALRNSGGRNDSRPPSRKRTREGWGNPVPSTARCLVEFAREKSAGLFDIFGSW